MKRLSVQLLVLLAVSTAGCATPGVCPAIGWSNSAIVVLDGPVDGVAKVQFCLDGNCSMTPQPSTAPKNTVTPGVSASAGQAESAAPATPGTPVGDSKYSPFSGKKIDDRTWQFSTAMNAPKKATVRALAASGEVLAAREVDLTWTRVGGSEQCGGPSTTGPIPLAL
ncbi:hypothetical protein [Arthrobacter sp. ZGTC412]|uniref:hypothetical protein n=2 Tax=unclassified Arthrobacter TaxID=235627 RepID=UPI0011B06713|nr:hypothetical protein [Arthrobacter sp. ZGTC412]